MIWQDCRHLALGQRFERAAEGFDQARSALTEGKTEEYLAGRERNSMIVHILTEGEYEVGDKLLEELNRIDNELVEVVGRGDNEQLSRLFGQMLDLVRDRGKVVPSTELVASDVVVPPPDTILEEAWDHFKGEGLIPG